MENANSIGYAAWRPSHPTPLPSGERGMTGISASELGVLYVDEKNISKNRIWNLFGGLELRFECLGQSKATSSKRISEEPTLKHEPGGD